MTHEWFKHDLNSEPSLSLYIPTRDSGLQTTCALFESLSSTLGKDSVGMVKPPPPSDDADATRTGPASSEPDRRTYRACAKSTHDTPGRWPTEMANREGPCFCIGRRTNEEENGTPGLGQRSGGSFNGEIEGSVHGVCPFWSMKRPVSDRMVIQRPKKIQQVWWSHLTVFHWLPQNGNPSTVMCVPVCRVQRIHACTSKYKYTRVSFRA